MPDKVSETPSSSYEASSHTRKFLVPSLLKKHVDKAVKLLRSKKFNKKYKFDTLAFSGYSGAMIAIPISQKIGKDLVLVRKTGEKRASSYDVEGFEGVKSYIIVDDFTCSGETVHRIQRGVKKFASDAKCLGVLCVQELAGDKDDDLETRQLMKEENL